MKEGVYLIANNAKKGVLNAAGNPILPLDFDQIQVENKDFFIVTKDKLSGIMRANGDTFLSLKYSEVAIDWEEQKVFVKGKNAHPIYLWAKQSFGTSAEPKWNFHKYLVDKEGRVVDYYYSITNPTSSKIKRSIKKILED